MGVVAHWPNLLPNHLKSKGSAARSLKVDRKFVLRRRDNLPPAETIRRAKLSVSAALGMIAFLVLAALIAAVIGVWVAHLDVNMSVALVTLLVTGGFAYMQWRVAKTSLEVSKNSLQAAYEIARDQAARAYDSERQHRLSFISTALALGTRIVEKADGVTYEAGNWHDWQLEAGAISRALAAIQFAAPAESALILAFQELRDALTFGPADFASGTAAACELIERRTKIVKERLATINSMR